MKVNLSELSYKDKIEINEKFSFSKEYLENLKIQKLNDVSVEGFVYQNDLDEYKCKLHIWGEMILLDSITLDEIPYEFEFDLDEELNESCINEQNVLDIIELLWENIVLEVPIRYTKGDADNLKGDNWKVLNETSEEDKIDPRMAKLYDYYKGGE